MSLSKGISITPVSDRLVLLDERRGHIYHLNQTAATILSVLIEGGSAAAATAALRSRYSVTTDVAQRDVIAFVATLVARRLMAAS